MARSDAQTNVRLPMELKEWLVKQAEAQRRSLTNEIILRLEESRARQGVAQQLSK